MSALQSLGFFIPETVLLLAAFLVLILDFFIVNKRFLGYISIGALILTAFLCHPPAHPMPLFFGFFALDHLTHFFRMLVLGMIAVTVLASLDYSELSKKYEGEYYSLLLFMALALILMAASTNLLMAFMNVEFVSILSYLMVGMLKKDVRSKEAALKYLLFGSAASAVMLYGMSLLYGLSGSLDFVLIQARLANPDCSSAASIALIFVFVGLGFKISMAPFHMWAPDVYEAAPTPISGLLTVAPKAVGFGLFLRFLTTVFQPLSMQAQDLLLFFSILTMTIGNVTAISQSNIKRLLAYSSVAQAGYILMGLVALNDFGSKSVLAYLVAYALTNLGAFIVVIAASNATGNDDLLSYSGLSKRSPFLAAALTFFLLSLAGLPPLAGYIAKFLVFSTAISGRFFVLAVAAAMNSLVAAFYYFRVVKMMYLTPEIDDTPIATAFSLRFAIILTLAGIFILGCYPIPLFQWTAAAF